MQPNAKGRPKSWYGSQVPGKPKRDNAFLNEMQSKLSRRKDKVDAESYVVETPDHLVESLPPSGPRRDRDTPPTDYSPFMQRRTSKDSGRFSLTPSCDGDFTQYRRVSVDLERKEELILAKQVRKSSAKMLRTSSSPCSWEQNMESPPAKSIEDSPSETPTNVPEASPVVMRYWRQCAGADSEEKEVDGANDNDEGKHKIEQHFLSLTLRPRSIIRANLEDGGNGGRYYRVPEHQR